MKQTLWIISELFPPDETSTSYIMGEIANAMTSKYKVKVICGPEIYDPNRKVDLEQAHKLDSSIELYRVKGCSENKKSTISRIRKFLLVSWRLYRKCRKLIQKNDKVLMVSNPFPLIILMACLKRKRGFSLSMLVHDVFMEGLYTRMNADGIVFRLANSVFNKAYSRMDLLISLGRDMSEVLKRKTNGKVKIEQIENWADCESIFPKGRATDGKVTIEYAGNFGRAQGLLHFIDLFSRVDNKHIEFSLWGSGELKDEICHRSENDSRIKLHRPYLRCEQVDVLNDCDIALVTLLDGMYGLGVPSKSYNILAAGKPIFYIGERNSEIDLMVRENKIGYSYEANEENEIVMALNSLQFKKEELREMGMRARELAEKKFSKNLILGRFIEIV